MVSACWQKGQHPAPLWPIFHSWAPVQARSEKMSATMRFWAAVKPAPFPQTALRRGSTQGPCSRRAWTAGPAG
eukprot:9432322-Lingulodinium_polyedra.AAC.1